VVSLFSSFSKFEKDICEIFCFILWVLKFGFIILLPWIVVTFVEEKTFVKLISDSLFVSSTLFFEYSFSVI
jgi:hypothetical protein